MLEIIHDKSDPRITTEVDYYKKEGYKITTTIKYSYSNKDYHICIFANKYCDDDTVCFKQIYESCTKKHNTASKIAFIDLNFGSVVDLSDHIV